MVPDFHVQNRDFHVPCLFPGASALIFLLPDGLDN